MQCVLIPFPTPNSAQPNPKNHAALSSNLLVNCCWFPADCYIDFIDHNAAAPMLLPRPMPKEEEQARSRHKGWWFTSVSFRPISKCIFRPRTLALSQANSRKRVHYNSRIKVERRRAERQGQARRTIPNNWTICHWRRRSIP